MIIFTPNTVIKSADINLNLDNIKNGLEFADFVLPKLYSNGTGGDTNITISVAWTAYAVPNTQVDITPTKDVTAIVFARLEINRAANASQEQDCRLEYKVGAGAWTGIGVGTLASIGGNTYLVWSTENMTESVDLTAGTAYSFRVVVASGSTGIMTVRGRSLKVITIAR